MKDLIRKILKEELKNELEVMSNKINLCDIMSVNTWDEIESHLNQMDFDSNFTEEITEIKRQYKNEVNTQSHDGDSANFYLRKIQTLVCR